MFFSEKQWTQKIFRNVLQCFMQEILLRGQVFYMREKNYSIFSDMQVFVKICLNILLHCIINTLE